MRYLLTYNKHHPPTFVEKKKRMVLLTLLIETIDKRLFHPSGFLFVGLFLLFLLGSNYYQTSLLTIRSKMLSFTPLYVLGSKCVQSFCALHLGQGLSVTKGKHDVHISGGNNTWR